MSLYELKMIVKDNNIEVTEDKRVRLSYVNAIIRWQEDKEDQDISDYRKLTAQQDAEFVELEQYFNDSIDSISESNDDDDEDALVKENTELTFTSANKYLDKIQAKRDELGDYTSDIEDIAWLVDNDDLKKNH